MAQNSSDFSFDLYPGLDRELDEVYQRNVEQGTASGEAVAATALAATVGNTLAQQNPNVNMNPNALPWATIELDIRNNGAIETWNSYETLLGTKVPIGMTDLLDSNPNARTSIDQFYEARKALIDSGETTPEGLNVGESMHLALIPWKSLRDNLGRLPEWVKEMRNAQGIATNDDYFDSNLLSAIQNDTELYRNPLAGHFYSTNGTTAPDWLSAKDYLDQQIAHHGNWGIMLVQTSNDAGLESLVAGPSNERSPNALTNDGTENFQVAGQKVDGLGIFEWLSLTFQVDPSTLSSRDVSWLLANRFESGNRPDVPLGSWRGGRVRSNLLWAAYDDVRIRPRLAVIGT